MGEPGAGSGGEGGGGRSGEDGRGAVDRTSLANERTLLAWLRTALALLAASFAVVRLTDITPRGLRIALGAYLIAMATGVTVAGYVQWHSRQLRIRPGVPAARYAGAPALTAALLLLAAFVVAVTVLAP